MLTKFIIALLSLQPTLYINEAERLFSRVQDQYIDGSGSHPHVTLCQFYTDEANIKKIEADLKVLHNSPQSHLTGIHFVKDPTPGLWGAELSAARDTSLMVYHNKVTIILKKHNIHTYINDTGDLFRPHLTLARVNKLELEDFNENLLHNTSFVLATGEAGPLGQFEKIRKQF